MTKEEVLAVFEKGKGEIISGIELAERLGVTRTAIWKAINSLREEGYDIESIKKKGYRLNVNSDILSIIKIKENLRNDQYDIKVFKTLDSTNKVAKLCALEEDKEWLVVASEMQEAGRGRMNTAFLSPEGRGVYMSVVLKPYVEITASKALIALSGQAVREAIRRCTGIEVEIQKPSDIMYQGKKVGGILTEVDLELETGMIQTAVIGIGIHIYSGLPSNEKMTSLSELIGKYCNRSELIAEVLKVLDVLYREWKIKNKEA